MEMFIRVIFTSRYMFNCKFSYCFPTSYSIFLETDKELIIRNKIKAHRGCDQF